MIKSIIFDYNETLYITKQRCIPKKTIKLLEKLRKDGFLLALISINDPERKKILEKYDILHLFFIIKFVNEKNAKIFRETLRNLNSAPNETIVVGDRIKSEITIANNLGIRTVWFKNGKFSKELPILKNEFPDYRIENLSKLIDILKGG